MNKVQLIEKLQALPVSDVSVVVSIRRWDYEQMCWRDEYMPVQLVYEKEIDTALGTLTVLVV